jgi:hypothetical protein
VNQTASDFTPLVKKPQTASEVLDIIDEFFLENANPGNKWHDLNAPDERRKQEAKKLWDVLSALRGPDDGHLALKYKSTSPLRSAAFPKSAAAPLKRLEHAGPVVQPVAEFDFDFVMQARPRWDDHFRTHVRSAALALGLL